MAAVFEAFVQYLLTFVYFVIIAGAGIFAGKALHNKKKKDATKASQE